MARGGGLRERELELEIVDEAICAATEGGGTALVVEGPAGIGKTSLLDEARHRANERAMTVVVAQGSELESEFGFGVVRQLFEATLAGAPDESRQRWLRGAAQHATPAVLPGRLVAGEVPVQQPAIVHGLYWLVSNLAETAPLLIAVDDVHWADAPSLQFLSYLTRRLDGMHVLVVLTLRRGDPGADGPIITQLTSGPALRSVQPRPLSPTAVRSIVEDQIGAGATDDFVRACHVATNGVPFLLRELVEALAADRVPPTTEGVPRVAEVGPRTVAQATALRMSWLTPHAVAVAQTVAILGRHARLDRVADLCGLDEAEVRPAVDALAAMHILSADSLVRFEHPLVQRAVYDDMPPAARADGHGRAAALLARQSAPLDEVSAHLLLSAPTGDASSVDLLRAAAAQATARGAPGSSVAYLRRAIDEGASSPVRSELLHELGLVAALIADPDAIGYLEDAFRSSEDAHTRARIAYRLGELYYQIGDWARCEEQLELAVSLLDARDVDLAARFEAGRATNEAYHPRTAHLFEERLPRLRALLDQPAPGARNLALRVAAAVTNRWDDHGEVLALVERGLDAGRFVRDEGPESFDLFQAFLALLGRDELALAERLSTDVVDEARRRGSILGYAIGSLGRGWVESQRGRLEAAEADFRTVLDFEAYHGWIPTFLLSGLDLLLERPELDRAARLAESTALDPTLAESASGATLLLARGKLRLGHGRRREAIADLRNAGAIFDATQLRNPIVWSWRCALARALPPEAVAESRALVAEELDIARAMALPRAVGVALRAHALLERGDAAVGLLEESLSVLAGCPSALERARSTIDLGAALSRVHRMPLARERLWEGLELARDCGASRLEARAFELLGAAGAKPRRKAVTGLDALTPSELRVARMAADGMTNREIAQDLFVTAKTVENQLGAVYRKLGVHSRVEVAAALRDRSSIS